MQKVKNHIDQLFKELPHSKHALQRKQEILENMEERYQELRVQEKNIQDIEEILISEIGTSQELRENINLYSPKQQLVTMGIYLVLFFLSLIYIYYAPLNLVALSYSLTIFWGIIFILKLIRFIIKSDKNLIQNNSMRLLSLCMSLFLIILVAIFGVFPSVWVNTAWEGMGIFILIHANIIAGISGVLFFMGSKIR